MSIMISPRSQENQYHYQQQNPPPHPSAVNGQQQQQQPGAYPIYSNIAQFPTQPQAGAFNLAYNNNYTTTNPLPPSNNSSFSLPSVPQAVYYEQVPPLQQQAPPPPQQQPQQQGHPENGVTGGAPVYYYQQQFFTQPNPTSANDQFGGYPQFGFHDQSSSGALNTIHSIPPPHQPQLQVATASTTSLPQPSSTAATGSTNTPSNTTQQQQSGVSSSSEEMPFPGVLDTSSNNGNTTYHPRSATYPVDHKPAKQHSRQSLANSSTSSSTLLGMTPETARRNRCTICQKQFKRPSSLQTHLYSHTGEKPFACTWDNCGRLFSVRSNMIRHRKLHERDAKLKGSLDASVDGLKEDPEESDNVHVNNNKSILPPPTAVINGNGNNGGFNGTSLPNLLHPAGNGNGNGEFQLGYFN